MLVASNNFKKLAFICLTVVSIFGSLQSAQASIITTYGDQNSTLELELTSNRYQIDLLSVNAFDQFYIPFLSSDDASKAVANFVGWDCQYSGNFVVCVSGINNLVVSISGYFTLPTGYEFGEFLRPGNNRFYSSDGLYFETFYANLPEIRLVSNQNPNTQVSEPSMFVLLTLSFLVLTRRQLVKK